MRDLDAANYTISQACEVAGLNVATGRSWFQKGWISLWTSDQKARTAGATTLISHRSVLALAIAARATQRGVHPQLACKAAAAFTQKADPLDAHGQERDPGELFDRRAGTVLVIYPDGTDAVLPIKQSSLGDLVYPKGIAGGSANGRQEDGFFLMLDFVVKHVEIELDRIGGRG